MTERLFWTCVQGTQCKPQVVGRTSWENRIVYESVGKIEVEMGCTKAKQPLVQTVAKLEEKQYIRKMNKFTIGDTWVSVPLS